MSVGRRILDPWGRSHVDPREGGKKAPNRAQPMLREGGTRFNRSAGHFETTALRFCAANASWCFPEQKQAITLCEEVFSEPSWSESPRDDCKAMLLRIVEDIHERHQWHDGLRAHQREVLLACEDSWGRRVKVAPISEHLADNKHKRSLLVRISTDAVLITTKYCTDQYRLCTDQYSILIYTVLISTDFCTDQCSLLY